jgi:hypothetical protein
MMQVIQQTDEEKLTMYMKLSKEELAKMLIEANRHIERIGPIIITNPMPYPVYPTYPNTAPYNPLYPLVTYSTSQAANFID